MTSRRVFDRATFLHALYCLDVSPPITAASIVRAYRQKVKAHHPDQFQSDAEKLAATLVLQKINDARDYITAHLTVGLDFTSDAAGPAATLNWTREECVAACAEYERIWPADPRD